MSDLISRRELIKHFEEIQQQENAVGLEFVAMIDEIKEQPTAYSVEKVVEDLEKIKGLACEGRSCNKCKYKSICMEGEQSKKVAIDEAIEIVKQGGVSDDVNMCECRELKDYNSLLKTSCGYVFGMGKEFKYCPYCGKKIKIVGD